VVAWDGGITALPHGFAALRLEATRLIRCTVTELLAQGGSKPQRFCTGNPAHLLCRALCLAPACYRHFSLAVHPLDGSPTQLKVEGTVWVIAEPGSDPANFTSEDFDSVACLAAAMGQFAAVEGLNVQLSPDASCVIVRRN